VMVKYRLNSLNRLKSRCSNEVVPFSQWEKVARERRMRVGGVCRRKPWQGRCDGSRRKMRRAPHPLPPLPPGEGMYFAV